MELNIFTLLPYELKLKVYNIHLNNISKLKAQLYDYNKIDYIDINIRDKHGKTLLYHCVIDDQPDSLALLIEKDAIINLQDYAYYKYTAQGVYNTKQDYALHCRYAEHWKMLVEKSKTMYISKSTMRIVNRMLASLEKYNSECLQLFIESDLRDFEYRRKYVP